IDCGSELEAPRPINVKFLIVGFEMGPARCLFELLSASTPLFPLLAASLPYQYSLVPFQPSVQSKRSSSFDVDTKYLVFTVPPNHSKPSSEPSCTCTYSIVVPAPTPNMDKPLNSL